MYIGDGGTAMNVKIIDISGRDTIVTVSSGGVLSGAVISSGYNGSPPQLTILSGGMAYDITSGSGADIIVSEGGTITYAE